MLGDSGPLIVAHRGAWAGVPQNSVAALQAAVELGCDMVELDVRMTRDRQLVAVHDGRFRGTAVASLTNERLRAPLLEELLEAAAGRIALDVELKRPGYEAQVLEALERHGSAYVITSFLPTALIAVKRVHPDTRTGLLLRTAASARGLERRLGRAAADFVAAQLGLARGGVLAWAAARRRECWVWTVNEPRALRAMLNDPRVSALITDEPERALAIRGARAIDPHLRAGDLRRQPEGQPQPRRRLTPADRRQ